MFSKNIIFKNFLQKKNINVKKKINNILKKELIKSNALLNSFNKNYKYSYKKEILNRYKKFNTINLIGMGGSILGTQAIYDFFKHRIKKNFNFFDNLQAKKFVSSNEKKINILVSKSGNTLETISNFNILRQKEKKNKIFLSPKKK